MVAYWSSREFIIEQPFSTLIHLTLPFSAMLRMTGASSIATDHGLFAHDPTQRTQKKLKLMGTPRWLTTLTVPTPSVNSSVSRRRWAFGACKKTLYTTKVDRATGQKKTYGKKRDLKLSEHYSAEFSEAIARAFAATVATADAPLL